jgi:hypothetical protein
MAWWATLLVALVGAAGGVIGGWLSGRIGSRATLEAVREERAARQRIDYLTALASFQQSAAMTISFATELPPQRPPTRFDSWSLLPTRPFIWLFRKWWSEREIAAISQHLLTTGVWSRRLPWSTTFSLAQSRDWERSVERRVDSFLEASGRVRALAPASDLDVLRRAEELVIRCVKETVAQDAAFAEWEPLREELAALAEGVYFRQP